jgi:hypothetical protein
MTLVAQRQRYKNVEDERYGAPSLSSLQSPFRSHLLEKFAGKRCAIVWAFNVGLPFRVRCGTLERRY